ncbi:hypothetical protein F2Q70_00001680 [Brassica cretica]|uniref:Uncharacterized protein n=1 Tax=Brassica cretica TaxID=69181 RepID=A0A8S9IZ17_BRACR|nr:hypothetical protein F2Q70_00001680 [Brassica cretica]
MSRKSEVTVERYLNRFRWKLKQRLETTGVSRELASLVSETATVQMKRLKTCCFLERPNTAVSSSECSGQIH